MRVASTSLYHIECLFYQVRYFPFESQELLAPDTKRKRNSYSQRGAQRLQQDLQAAKTTTKTSNSIRGSDHRCTFYGLGMIYKTSWTYCAAVCVHTFSLRFLRDTPNVVPKQFQFLFSFHNQLFTHFLKSTERVLYSIGILSNHFSKFSNFCWGDAWNAMQCNQFSSVQFLIFNYYHHVN